ncbi:unnamed protein product [Cochlearia groenlandica]
MLSSTFIITNIKWPSITTKKAKGVTSRKATLSYEKSSRTRWKNQSRNSEQTPYLISKIVRLEVYEIMRKNGEAIPRLWNAI